MELDVTLFESHKQARGTRTRLSLDELAKLCTSHKVAAKGACGALCAAVFKSDHRKNENVEIVTAAVLDVERQPRAQNRTREDILAGIRSVGVWCCVASTHSDKIGEPRLRIVIPFTHPTDPDRAELAARAFSQCAKLLDYVDPCSFRPAQLAFLPTCEPDAQPFSEIVDGKHLEPNEAAQFLEVLHGTWTDRSKWPHSQSEQQQQPHTRADKQQDPTTKTGTVGAFCRVYDIHRAISDIIPDTYEQTADPNRWTLSTAHTSGGLIIYENGLFCYSHHATDPAGGRLLNAFDLCRIHLFGDCDPENDDRPENRRESFRKMLKYAEDLPEVQDELRAERMQTAADELAALTETEPQDTLGLVCLESIEERKPEFLLYPYIPKYEITLLAGDGGAGKGHLWAEIVAKITQRGEKVLVFSSEDSLQFTIRGRLRRAGADLRNVLAMDAADAQLERIHTRSVYLEKLIDRHRPALVILDPLQAFLPPGVNIISRNDVRQAMKGLHVWGEKFGVSFLIVMHTNKKVGSEIAGRSRLADSSDLWDIARSVLLVGYTGEKTADGDLVRYCSHEKSNYAKTGQTLEFCITDNGLRELQWTDKMDADYRGKRKERPDAPKLETAKADIVQALREAGGQLQKSAFEALQITPRTLDRAISELKNAEILQTERRATGQGSGVQTWVKLS